VPSDGPESRDRRCSTVLEILRRLHTIPIYGSRNRPADQVAKTHFEAFQGNILMITSCRLAGIVL
jgi:hypothetical protein